MAETNQFIGMLTDEQRSGIVLAKKLLPRATTGEVASRYGRILDMKQHSGDTIVSKRYLPWGATPGNNTQNRFFETLIAQHGSGGENNLSSTNLAAAYAQAGEVVEGQRQRLEGIRSVTVSATIRQFIVAHGYTDRMYHFHEDNIPDELVDIVAERMRLLKEMVVWATLQESTATHYPTSSITTLGGVNAGINYNMLSRMAATIRLNHGMFINREISASQNISTVPVESGYVVLVSTQMEDDIRDLDGFSHIGEYGMNKAAYMEFGKINRVRFITCPDFLPRYGAGASSTSFLNTGGSVDVFPFVMMAEDFFAKVAVRGMDSIMPFHKGLKSDSKYDYANQFGIIGAKFWFTSVIENQGWGALGWAGVSAR